jgi:hypothetical protein
VFTLIFVSLFVVAWLILAFVPWLLFSVFTRGNAGLANLPLCLFTGLVAALAVPTLGMEDWRGVWLSMAMALCAPTLLMVLRRISLEPARRALPGEAETK